MKLQRVSSSPFGTSPYARRHPLLLRWLTTLIICAMLSGGILVAIILSPHKDNRMNSRMFYMLPKLHSSKPKTDKLDLSRFKVFLLQPVDKRSGFSVTEFHKSPAMHEIQNKIETDMTYFGANQGRSEPHKNLTITTTVDEFYSDVRGNCWMKSKADVTLDMKAVLNDSTIVNKQYQSSYSTSGLDKEYEGSMITTIEQGANITLGISLRKALDQFYADLAGVIAPPTVPLKNVLFKVSSTDFEDIERSEANLDATANLMKRNRKMVIELDGYADNLGDLIKDKELSLDRVKVVKSYLVHHGIRARRIKTKAFGAARSISNSHNEESHRLNRRVEFKIIKS